MRFIDITDTRKLHTLPPETIELEESDVITGKSGNSDTGENEVKGEKDIDILDTSTFVKSPRLPVMYQISKKKRTSPIKTTQDYIRKQKLIEEQQGKKKEEVMPRKDKYVASEAEVDTGADSCGIDIKIIEKYCDTTWQKAHFMGYSIVDSIDSDKSGKGGKDNDKLKSEDAKTNESENDENKNSEELDKNQLKPSYEMQFHVMDGDDKPLTINTFPVVCVNSNVIGGGELKHLMQAFEYGESNCVLHHKKDYKKNELYFANGERVTQQKYINLKRQWKQGKSRIHRLHFANIDMRPTSKVLQRIGLLRYEQLRKRKEKENGKGKDKDEDKDKDKDMITEDDIWPVLQAQLEFHGDLPHLKEDFEKYKHLLFKPTNEEILGSSRKDSKGSINTNSSSGRKYNGDNNSVENSSVSFDASLSPNDLNENDNMTDNASQAKNGDLDANTERIEDNGNATTSVPAVAGQVDKKTNVKENFGKNVSSNENDSHVNKEHPWTVV